MDGDDGRRRETAARLQRTVIDEAGLLDLQAFPGADLDMDMILESAAATNTILEINANPRRLDLRDIHVRHALKLGVRIAINTDAHHSDHFDFLHYGVSTAQRGWASAEEIVNTVREHHALEVECFAGGRVQLRRRPGDLGRGGPTER